ncbi:MAG: preprotein translocase subunit SecY [Nitrospinae bacterium]|nr:preprotein translocase subunit SecY [Nitrospinota bacterium]
MAVESFGNIFRQPELKKRLVFTIAILAVYRIGAHIPVPGIDASSLADFFAQMRGSVLQFFDMFSGGALSRLTIFALGIMPYVSSSIIIQLLTVAVPHLERLKKEGEAGQRKINQYTRYGTILLASVQGLGIAFGLEAMRSPSGAPVVPDPGWDFRLLTVLTLAAGTAFIMWLGEQITERGVGNGISLIIFSGIVAEIPSAIINSFRLMQTGELSPIAALVTLVLMVAVIGVIVFMESGQRRIPVQYARRMVGRKMYQGQSSHLPLKINMSGVIPPIFASALIMFPATIAGFIQHPMMQKAAGMLAPGTVVHISLYMAMIIFFCYFYTAVVFNPDEVADNMKKNGGFVPGIRPGKPTGEYIDRILTRITAGGAIYLALICVLPDFMIKLFNVPFYFGGTGLLIVVGVAMDTVAQIESHLVMRQYGSFIKGTRMKGRQG